MSLSSLTNGRLLPSRPQSAGAITCTKKPSTQIYTKRHRPGDRVKHTSPYRDSHTCLHPTVTHTFHHDDTRPTSPASDTTAHVIVNNTDCKYSPAGVPVCNRWLCLPDEVWLSILSLLPHSNLCRVVQVCSRLHTLASDHTLWKNLKIENSSLTERWLLFVGKCRPQSLCLYSCSSLSVTSCGLEMFFTLSKNSLEEVKVTSCTGPGLHGDQMLALIGQMCDHVTSVDVSWSGATDTGVKALSDGCAGLRLESVVLNGCHVTNEPLKKLVMRHKESLCRLEVFGCQFLTPSCLHTIYEMCPGLKHLNIGQVPKVNTLSLTVMTSQLKCLISLNLTGLQAVTDATLDTLLQNCVKLHSLTLSSCPGVTDVTLQNVSKYTPCIRSLDISGCKAVTDAGVQSLTLGCRRLQQLDLSSTGTGNRGVTLLANYCSGHLHTVKLSFCNITSENILKLCRCCKRLKVLHLYGCAHLPTEEEIREVNNVVKVYPLP
ncbi:F-box/LRR-repeat protein 20-like [Toxotes jaculatrix]|uniref:F-box/LRR-repeat protein 20-like n=1 Tax=Toxotes jaculatrix TaxID=941984 RepID=UPI001B3B0AFA|nr:F-box/LRR-repeat protein 20-like [Toxotes jaculatrix]